MPAERLCQRDEQTDRQPHKTDRNSHELCIMQRAKKKLFQFLQLHLMAARRGGRGRARGKRGSCLCLPPNACSMQCLYLPLLLQVNLPHRLCLITVSRRDGERGERGRREEEKKERQTDRRWLQFALAVHFLASKCDFPHKFFRLGAQARKVLISLHTRHKLHM